MTVAESVTVNVVRGYSTVVHVRKMVRDGVDARGRREEPKGHKNVVLYDIFANEQTHRVHWWRGSNAPKYMWQVSPPSLLALKTLRRLMIRFIRERVTVDN
jgi:hypothetical protein